MSKPTFHHTPSVRRPAQSAFGDFVHRWLPSSTCARLFMAITLAEAVVNISIEAVLLSRYNSTQGLTIAGSNSLRTLPVFVLCFCLAHSYQTLLSVDACINRNVILVFGLVIFNACFLIYSLIQIGEIRQVLGTGVVQGTGQTVPVQVLTGAIPIVIGVSQVAFTILAWFLWKEFGWQVYKAIIGADRMLKKAYSQYALFVALLKFDFFVFIAFCLQLVLVVLTSDPVEKWLTIIAAPIALVLLFFAWWSVRREKRWGMLVFMVGLLGAGFYFSYKLWRIWSEKDGLYAEVYKSLTVFAVIALVLDLATITLSVRCLANFGRGLSHAMDRAKTERQAALAAGVPYSASFGGKDLLPLSSQSTLHLPSQPRVSLD